MVHEFVHRWDLAIHPDGGQLGLGLWRGLLEVVGASWHRSVCHSVMVIDCSVVWHVYIFSCNPNL